MSILDLGIQSTLMGLPILLILQKLETTMSLGLKDVIGILPSFVVQLKISCTEIPANKIKHLNLFYYLVSEHKHKYPKILSRKMLHYFHQNLNH